MRTAKMIVAAAVLAFAVPASANTITFETALGGAFTGPVTEAGFTYQLFPGSGGLFVNGFGNPSQDMEGSAAFGGGVLIVTRADGGAFTFDSIDFSAFDSTGLGTPQDLIVVGAVNFTTVVGVDAFTLASTANFSPTYDNWTTEHASILAGTPINVLGMFLNAGGSPAGFFSENVDNIVLTPVPEPATLALFGAGLLGFAARRRRGNKA